MRRERSQERPERRLRARVKGGAGCSTVCIMGIILVLTWPTVASAAPVADGTSASGTIGAYAVPAVRQQLSTNAESPVIHDTETDALVAHDGRLFATTDQWEYSSPSPAGQILVKDSAAQPVEGVRADPGPSRVRGVGLLSDPERPGPGARAFLVDHPRGDRWALGDPVAPRRGEGLQPPGFLHRSLQRVRRPLLWRPRVRAGCGRSTPGSNRRGSFGAHGRRPGTPWSSTPRPS